MSTLKKVLALTLALAMVLSLNVFAAYNDQDKIDEDCVDAVNLLSDLTVLKGDDKGNFNPTDTITRAEVAAMVFRVMNKGNDASKTNWVGGKVFTDVVAGSWYEGYVNYCASLGLVAGKTPTTFDPMSPVTGYEVVKMLLNTLKYKTDVEGYTGANWISNVMTDATDIDLTEDYGMSLAAPAQRQWVAFLFNTALYKHTVGYVNGEAVAMTGDTTTLGFIKFGLSTETGIVNAIGGGALTGTTAVDTGKFVVGTKTFTKAVDTALLGQEVTVLYNANKSNKVYSVRATSKNTVAKAALNEVTYKDSKYTIGTMTAAVDGNTIAVVNNESAAFEKIVTLTQTKVNSTSPVIAINNDDDAAIDVVIVMDSQYGLYTVNSDGTGTLVGNPYTKTEAAKINFVNTVADKDFVKVTANPFTGKYDVEKLTANVATLMSKPTSSSYKLGSTTFKISAAESSVNNPTTYFGLSSTVLGTSVEYYTDGQFIVSAKTYAESTTVSELPAFVMLTAKGFQKNVYDSNNTYYVKTLGLDGKVSENQLFDTDAATTTAFYNSTDNVAGKIYTVTKNSDGTIKLNAASGVAVPTGYNKWATDIYSGEGTEVTNGLLAGKKIASDLTVFTVSGTTYGVAKISELTKKINACEGVVKTGSSSALASIAAAKVTLGAAITTTTTAPKALVVGDAYDEYNATSKKVEKKVDVIYADGTKATLLLDEDTSAAPAASTTAADTIYDVTITNGVAALEATSKVYSGALKVVDGSYLTIDTATQVAASSIVVVVKTSDGYSVSTLAKAIATGKTNAAKYLVNTTSGEVTFLFVDQTAAVV